MSKNESMTADRAKTILFCHNKWRRGDDDYAETDPAILGEAIDFAIQALSAPRVPVGFCEDTALSLAERTFSSEVDEHLAEDVIQYARRLHDLYASPEPVAPRPAAWQYTDANGEQAYTSIKAKALQTDEHPVALYPEPVAQTVDRDRIKELEGYNLSLATESHNQQKVIADLRAEVEALKARAPLPITGYAVISEDEDVIQVDGCEILDALSMLAIAEEEEPNKAWSIVATIDAARLREGGE